MITKKLPIIWISEREFVENKQRNYSYGFRRLHKMLDESEDKNFIERFKETFSMNDIEYRSLQSQVKAKRNQDEKNDHKRLKKIEEFTTILEDEKSTKREKFKAIGKIAHFSKRLGKEPTFGGLGLQQRLTRECNKEVRDEVKIKSLTDEFRKKRVMPMCVVGEANQKGNRFFDLILQPHKEGIRVSRTPQRRHNQIRD